MTSRGKTPIERGSRGEYKTSNQRGLQRGADKIYETDKAILPSQYKVYTQASKGTRGLKACITLERLEATERRNAYHTMNTKHYQF
jgi:hypothetical protein